MRPPEVTPSLNFPMTLSNNVILGTGLAWQIQASLSGLQKTGKTWLRFNFSGCITANSYSVWVVKSCGMTDLSSLNCYCFQLCISPFSMSYSPLYGNRENWSCGLCLSCAVLELQLLIPSPNSCCCYQLNPLL